VKLETQSIAKAWFIAALVNLTLNLLLLKVLGIIAAAISTALAFGVAFVVIKKRTDIVHVVRFTGIQIVRIILSSLAMGAAVGVCYLTLSQNLLLNLTVGIVLYCLFLLVFGVFEQREKKLIDFLFLRVNRLAR
jgi:O-antigen/teichoic acid export membrane protein